MTLSSEPDEQALACRCIAHEAAHGEHEGHLYKAFPDTYDRAFDCGASVSRRRRFQLVLRLSQKRQGEDRAEVMELVSFFGLSLDVFAPQGEAWGRNGPSTRSGSSV